MVATDSIETRACYIKKVDEKENILRIEKKFGVDVQLDDLTDIDNAYKQLLESRKGKFLIVFSDDCSSDKAMKEKFASKERSAFKKAEALVIGSLSNRLEANFYIRYYKPEHPIAVFTSEEAGIEWLKRVN